MRRRKVLVRVRDGGGVEDVDIEREGGDGDEGEEPRREGVGEE
jgi:hypothetical protein